MTHLPTTDANKGRLIAAGFNNGIVRILNVSTNGLEIMKAFKAHEDAIIGIQFSEDLKMCVTGSVTGHVFFFDMDGYKDTQSYEPLCTIKLPDEAHINDFRWSPDDKHVLFACKNGNVYKVRRPETKEIDNSDSYLWPNPDIKTWTIKLMDF